jgi:hypothetical protein
MYDHIADVNHAELSQISNLLEVPDFVKEATDITTADAIKDMSGDYFADPMTRSFPINSKADTWLSMAYLMKHAEELPQHKRDSIAARLLTAATFWGIDKSAFQAKPLEKTAAAQEPLMELEYKMDGRVYHSASLYTEADMEKAACDVVANHSKYPYAMRNGLCRQLLDKAEHLHNLAPEIVQSMEKTAGYVRTSARDFMNGMLERVELYKMHKHKQHESALLNCYKEAMANAVDGVITPEYMDKSARLIDHIDRLTGLYKTAPAAEEVWHGMTQKDAAFLNKHVVSLKNGQSVFTTKIKKHESNIRKFLSDVNMPVGADENIIEKVASMPIETVDLFCRIYGDALNNPMES